MFVFLVFIISTVINAVVACAQSDICNTTCSPFRLLVIWHTSNGEDAAFIEQKRLIIQLLLKIPQGTEIHMTAINTQRYHLLHLKNNAKIDWKDRIRNISMYYPESLENHTINDSLINATFFSFRKQNDKKDVSELTVLVVSEKTLIENSLETMKNIKRCVVFTGLNPPPPLWTSLATDRQHVVMLNITSPPPLLTSLATDRQHVVMLNMTSESIEANINGTADTVLDLFCRDSRLICDTDEFWTGKRCVSCSYICSADTKEDPDICLDLCPYYRWHSLENAYKEADTNVTVKRGEQNNDRIFISILLLLSVLTTVASAAVCVLLRRVRMLKQDSTAYLGRKHLDQETSRSHETIELRAEQERSFI